MTIAYNEDNIDVKNNIDDDGSNDDDDDDDDGDDTSISNGLRHLRRPHTPCTIM
jgi:hypothetical protein